MKKITCLLGACLLLASSCTTMRQTATVRDVKSPIIAMSYADLDINETKITYTYRPSEEDRRGGVRNCVNVAIREALATNGNADVLIETQEAIIEKTGLFGKKIKTVTVTGYPAVYKNFRPADKNVLNEAFTKGVFGSEHHQESKGINSFLKRIF